MSPQKLRRPGTFEDAITRIAGRLTADGAGAAIGRSGSLVRKAGDPDMEVSLSLQQALALDAAWRRDGGEGDGPILEAYAGLLDAAGAPAAHEPGEPLLRIKVAGHEFQEAIGAFIELRIQGVTPLRLHQAETEIMEAITALQAMLADLRAGPAAESGE